MIGLVLAAGRGSRLRPLTDELPKALVPVAGRTVLESTLANFAQVGMTDVVIVVGYRAEAIERLVPALECSTGVAVELVHNDHAEDRNNAYSLWCAREWLAKGVVLANGDTLHPASVETELLAAERHHLTLALDTVKALGHEEMKVEADADGRIRRVSKRLPSSATGEYIGVCAIPAACGDVLADALERTWSADAQRWYEDAFQLMADEGERIESVDIGDVAWVEIDDHADLAKAEALACRS